MIIPVLECRISKKAIYDEKSLNTHKECKPLQSYPEILLGFQTNSLNSIQF